MQTTHKIHFEHSANMAAVPSVSVQLVVTSPPYPMIEMWDDMFSQQNRQIPSALHKGDGLLAFELMHRQLDPVWREIHRILIDGGIACINIGDATRTIGGDFSLYPNHARVLTAMLDAGFSSLPAILWRKPTNAPNKFLGSGMLPVGAYVTLEHEYILIFRKGSKRDFRLNQKQERRHSAFFWEERNIWFSDVWFDIKGTRQALGDEDTRSRSAAFPFELVYRLIQMYSAKGDLVLDPFLGIGTSMAAAVAGVRNSTGYEIDPAFKATIRSIPEMIIEFSNATIRQRVQNHIEFCANRIKEKGPMKHINKYYGFPVMTAQEKELLFNTILDTEKSEKNDFVTTYTEVPQPQFCREWGALLETGQYREVLSKL